MDADWEMPGSRRHELSELDRVLDLLTRPRLVGRRVPDSVRSELLSLGVQLGRPSGRQDLIRQVWSRKRPLMRQPGGPNDLPPCA
jgi:hypothetical protein